jgi:hypothetical protein
VQEAFSRDARILISTDAGGEGLNLQFCHVVINYDIPWNPMRLEQRIGRVDRIGQNHTVRAINLVFDGSVEHRVREVLEQKLAVIFQEFGIDKTGDVLDSVDAGKMFDEVYVKAVLDPERVEESVEQVVERFQIEAREARESAGLLGADASLDTGEAQRLMSHPLRHWVERMTVSYLRAHGGHADATGPLWQLIWPDGTSLENVVFSARDAAQHPASRHLTLEEPRIRGLAMGLPRYAPGQPIPVVNISGVSEEIQGLWSLWRIGLATEDWNRRRIMPLFLSGNGKVYLPTARHIWDQLLVSEPAIHGFMEPDAALTALEDWEIAAEMHGKSIYDGLVQEHGTLIERKIEKAQYAFGARRNAIGRIGLPQVREHRLGSLALEEQEFDRQIEKQKQAHPEMVPLIVIRVEGADIG